MLGSLSDAVKPLVIPDKLYPMVWGALAHSYQPRRAGEDCLVQEVGDSDSSSTERLHCQDVLRSRYDRIRICTTRCYPEMAKDVHGLRMDDPCDRPRSKLW